MSDPIPFVVYYKGLPSHPAPHRNYKPDPFEEPSGPEAYSVLKELKQLGDHPLAMVWDGGLSDGLRRGLNTMRVTGRVLTRSALPKSESPPTWSSSGLASSSGRSASRGSVVAHKCRTFIDGYGIQGYHVEIRESRVMRQAGNRFFDPVPLNDPTFSARDPYTATSVSRSPLSRGPGRGNWRLLPQRWWRHRDIYLVTARHVLYERTNVSKAREDVVKLTAIENDIRDQEIAINEANQMIQSVEGMDDTVSVKQRRKAGAGFAGGGGWAEGLRALHHEIGTQWGEKEKRIFGELVWAPPIALSTEPGQYTLDLAVIRIDAGKLDAGNYRGNSINLGNNPSSFKLPIGLPESALVKRPCSDANGEPCLVVFKNGAQTGTTIGKANNYQESREWPIIPTDKYSGVFSAKGDSGSCIADAFSRIGGILTGGAANPNLPDSADVTYATPIT
ncbi:hypothetical protein EI94DRAFT_1753595, partial [Lactarius quietus]